MTCTNCGKEVAGASGKCPDCGAALKENQPPTDIAKPEESQVCRACGAPLQTGLQEAYFSYVSHMFSSRWREGKIF